MRMTRLLSLVILMFMAVPTPAAYAVEAWKDSFFPYRVRIELTEPASDEVTIDLPAAKIIEALASTNIDQMTEETLAFDKAILVDPESGDIVGGFVLTPAGPALEIDGDFAAWSEGKPSPWGASPPANASFERATADNESFGAILVKTTELGNSRLLQPLKLTPGQLYLLEHRILTDGQAEAIGVSLENPTKELFAELNHSYYNKMPPTGQWTHQRVLYQPVHERAELHVSTAFVQTGGVGGISLRPVTWTLQAKVREGATALDLYLVATSGHRLTQPQPSQIADGTSAAQVKVKSITPETQDFNPNGLLIDAGDGVKIWNIPNHLPMRAETIHATQPRAAGNGPLRMQLCRGTSGTIVLAVETLTPLSQFMQATCDLPTPAQFNRIAAIPVFDGFFPSAKQVETRFDAMTDLNFPMLPPSTSGVHPVAVHFAIPADATPGTNNGTITLTVQTQEPMTKTVQIPIELTILESIVHPMNHFGVIIGSQHLTAQYREVDKIGFVKDSISAAAFHGLRGEGLTDTWMSRMSRPDRLQLQKAPIRELATKYHHRMLDFDIVPQNIPLFANYSYTIVDQGEGKAPKLQNWDFTEFDKAIDDVLLKRNAPWLVIWHTNGHQMSSFDLSDGTVYSLKPGDAENPRIVLPPEELDGLVADYFEAIAVHLKSKGCLDRALVVIDESDTSTFPRMYEVVSAMKTRPHAKRIRFTHTTHRTGTYTQKLPDGRLVMNEVLDLPMPENDEHGNFFEPEWAARLTKPTMQKWVYYVQTDHLNLNNAGLTTIITPLKLRNFGVRGWYCWAALTWSMPYSDQHLMGPEFPYDPLVNPWLNPYYHHGHGQLSLFYPPDPRGLPDKPTDTIIPSYRLALIRDGIRDYALLDVLNKGVDDAGQPVKANAQQLGDAEAALKNLWIGNTVQWYVSYDNYRQFSQAVNEAFVE